MDEPDVFCTKCDWEGDTNQLDGIKCPKCGKAEFIEDFRPLDEPIWAYYKGFNWNKP